MTFNLHVGINFKHQGKHIRSFQMVSQQDNKAYAIADFDDDNLTRYLCADDHIEDGEKFLSQCKSQVEICPQCNSGEKASHNPAGFLICTSCHYPTPRPKNSIGFRAHRVGEHWIFQNIG